MVVGIQIPNVFFCKVYSVRLFAYRYYWIYLRKTAKANKNTIQILDKPVPGIQLVTVFRHIFVPQEDIKKLSYITKREHMRGSELMENFRTSQFTVRMSRDTYTQLRQQKKFMSGTKKSVPIHYTRPLVWSL